MKNHVVKENELVMLKSVSFKLDSETICIVTLLYHPKEKNVKGSRALFKYEGRIAKIKSIQNDIENLKNNIIGIWKWENLDSWDISYDGLMSNNRAIGFWERKIKKALDFETGINIINGYNTIDKKFNHNRKYTTEYKTVDNTYYFSLRECSDDLKQKLLNLGECYFNMNGPKSVKPIPVGKFIY